nr:uncharacterized protein LOC127339155 [Lolium perenne]
MAGGAARPIAHDARCRAGTRRPLRARDEEAAPAPSAASSAAAARPLRLGTTPASPRVAIHDAGRPALTSPEPREGSRASPWPRRCGLAAPRSAVAGLAMPRMGSRRARRRRLRHRRRRHARAVAGLARHARARAAPRHAAAGADRTGTGLAAPRLANATRGRGRPRYATAGAGRAGTGLAASRLAPSPASPRRARGSRLAAPRAPPSQARAISRSRLRGRAGEGSGARPDACAWTPRRARGVMTHKCADIDIAARPSMRTGEAVEYNYCAAHVPPFTAAAARTCSWPPRRTRRLQHGLELDPSRPRQVATEQIDGPLARIHPGPGRPYKILPTAARAAPLARVHPSVAVAAVDHVNAMPIIAWSSGPPQLGLVADGASCAARQIPPRASFPGPAPTTSSGVAVGTSTAYKQLISLSDADIRLYSSVADHGRRDSSVSSPPRSKRAHSD